MADAISPLLAIRLVEHGVDTSFRGVVAMITANQWFFRLDIRYGEEIGPMFGATVWIGPHVAPDVSEHAEGNSATEALGWALVAVLNAVAS